jgi:hypothetical protein
LSSSQTSKQEEEEGSHYQAKPVAPDLQNRWHRFWAVYIFHCAGACPEILEISPKIPDFPETSEKSLNIRDSLINLFQVVIFRTRLFTPL